ncbi:hypothetical protein N7G274_002853 [Stereocaulon virgatum]|uniref:PilZ domain-containing protein n=1 Tax=Stereocaulon virgatum TaxID=373712 RepID=A0ABR4AJ04_9LECA
MMKRPKTLPHPGEINIYSTYPLQGWLVDLSFRGRRQRDLETSLVESNLRVTRVDRIGNFWFLGTVSELMSSQPRLTLCFGSYMRLIPKKLKDMAMQTYLYTH